MSINLWLIGAGNMAQAYGYILNDLEVEYTVIGRGKHSAKQFENNIKRTVHLDGLKNYLDNFYGKLPTHAIVATNVDSLYEDTKSLLNVGVKYILVEKPGALDQNEFNTLVSLAKQKNAQVFLGYNRRLYSSVIASRKIIEQDGGIQSFHFEFTEWAGKIENLNKPLHVKNKWFLANSTHVVDLAFYLGGFPKNITCHVAGKLHWHPSGSIFSGSGISQSGALFSYTANWGSPGRWKLEMLTAKNRLILSPLEELKIQKKEEIFTEKFEIDNHFDLKYKPGLYLQVKKFIEGQCDDLCTIEQQKNLSKIYTQIAGYESSTIQ